MKLSKFKFNLPSELIALHPAKNRDESRLMVVHRDTGEIEHREFKVIDSKFDAFSMDVITALALLTTEYKLA